MAQPHARRSAVSPPAYRRLRTYAFDPSLVKLETAGLNLATLKVRWERDAKTRAELLQPGPVGEYVEVVDYDPASECFYLPVDLNDFRLVAQDGLDPSEGNPQFHQQMVYAVSMSTIQNFERALGRVALWSARDPGGNARGRYVQRLRVYPHAMRDANAYYSPARKALLFGYFPASLENPGSNLPGGTVFTCLSHDIVAHETTHALLDGLHPWFAEPSNPDVLAFHEAFADLVALLQHFTHPEVLQHQIARTRGDLARQNLLGQLAQQFGQAIGRYGALRDALGRVNAETHAWEVLQPDPADYAAAAEPHDRGAILVAAVFDGFLSIYKARIADLIRIATGGSGVLAEGELNADLVRRLAEEAAKSAQHVLTMCIRALDYCPPVDITFGEYLRALITADADLVPDDDRGYRLAVIEAFRRRGIYPGGVRNLAEDSLRWHEPLLPDFPGFAGTKRTLELEWDQKTDRFAVWQAMQANRNVIKDWLASGVLTCDYAEQLGLALGRDAPATIPRDRSGAPCLEVSSVRPVRRVGPDGQLMVDLVVELTQKRVELLDERNRNSGTFTFRGGCSLVVDLEAYKVRCAVAKNILSEHRLRRQRDFTADSSQQSLHATYFGAERAGAEPFLRLHRGL